MQPLEQEVAQFIIDTLSLEDLKVSDIDPAAPLFVKGLGLDSIDALQLVVGMENAFGVVVPDAAVGTKVFQSVRTMADYIALHMA